MLLLKLILMLTLVTASDPEGGGAAAEPTTVKEPLCGDTNLIVKKMRCLAPGKCIGNPAKPKTLLMFDQDQVVDKNCAGIFMFRVYSPKKWLVVMKTFDPNVKTISLNRGNTKYECSHISGDIDKCPNVEATSFPMDKKTITLIGKSISPLMCEFVVETEVDDEFLLTISNNALLKLKTDSSSDEYTMKYSEFQTFPTCNHVNAITPEEGSVGDKMVVKIEEADDSQDLVCKQPYSYSFRDTSESEFKPASTIKCFDQGNINQFGYSAMDESQVEHFFLGAFEARCEVATCKMCPPDPPKFPWEIESQFIITIRPDGCQELKCKNGGNLVLRENNPNLHVSVDVTCRHHKEHGLVFMDKNEKPILPDTHYECLTGVPCKEEKAQKLCPGCVVNKQNLPQCSDTAKLTWHGQEAAVSCDIQSGEFDVKNVADGKGIAAHAKDPLRCEPIKTDVPPPPPASGCTEQQVAEFSKKYMITTALLSVALTIALLVVAYFVIEKRRAAIKANKAATGQSGKVVPIKMLSRSRGRKGPNPPSNSSGSGSIEPPANSKSTTTPDKTLETPDKDKEEKKKRLEMLEERMKEKERQREKELEMERKARMTPAELMAAQNLNPDNPYTPDESRRRPTVDI